MMWNIEMSSKSTIVLFPDFFLTKSDGELLLYGRPHAPRPPELVLGVSRLPFPLRVRAKALLLG